MTREVWGISVYNVYSLTPIDDDGSSTAFLTAPYYGESTAGGAGFTLLTSKPQKLRVVTVLTCEMTGVT